MLVLTSQDDVVTRRVCAEGERAFVPDFGVVIRTEDARGDLVSFALSRQLVLLCIERRKSWRLPP